MAVKFTKWDNLGKMFEEFPKLPPHIEARKITGTGAKWYWFKPVTTTIVAKWDSWEKKIIAREYIVASFIEIEKNTINKDTLSGPPPIPKKLEIKPNRRPQII